MQYHHNYTMSGPHAEVYHILAAHVINDILKRAVTDTLLLPLLQFLAEFNELIASYEDTFHYTTKSQTLDEDFVRNLILNSDLCKLVSVDDDAVQLKASPQILQPIFASIVVDSSIKYSKVLVSEIQQLDAKFRASAELPTTTEETVQGDDMEVDEREPTADVVVETKTEEPEEIHDAKEQEAEVKEEVVEPSHEEVKDVDVEATAEVEEEEVEPAEDEQTEEKAEEAVEEEVEAEEKKADEEEAAEAVAAKEEDEDVEAEEEVEKEATPQFEELTKKTKSPKSIPEELKDDILKTERKRSLSPLASSQKRKRFQNIAINLIKTIEEHRFSSPFLTRVLTDNYEDVIYDPKDLKSILKAIKQKDDPVAYETVKDLERDIILMFANCVMFNKSSTHLVNMAKEMKDDVRTTFKMFEEAESDIK